MLTNTEPPLIKSSLVQNETVTWLESCPASLELMLTVATVLFSLGKKRGGSSPALLFIVLLDVFPSSVQWEEASLGIGEEGIWL